MTAKNPYERLYRDFKEAGSFDEKLGVQIAYTIKGSIFNPEGYEWCTPAVQHVFGFVTINPSSGKVAYRDVRLAPIHFMGSVDQNRIGYFKGLCREAGSILPKATTDLFGIPLDVTPELRWLGLVVAVLRNHGLGYVKRSDGDNPSTGPYCHDTVDQPFLACAKAIEMAGLLKEQGAKKRPRISRKEANLKGRKIIERKKSISARDLADEIGCSLGMISKLGCWQAIQEERKKRHKPAPPKAVNFSDKLEAMIGEDDPELRELIDDQAQDDEGSPLGVRAKSARIRKRG